MQGNRIYRKSRTNYVDFVVALLLKTQQKTQQKERKKTEKGYYFICTFLALVVCEIASFLIRRLVEYIVYFAFDPKMKNDD